MPERILEKNGVDNTNIDGAGFNRFCAGNKDGIIRGILNECAATIQGNTFTLSTGELIICGFRIVVESPIVKTFTTTPVTPIIYQLIGEIQVSSSSEVQFAWRFQTVQQLTQDNLFNTLSGQGTYQAEICRFIQGSDGSLGALVTTMDIISGGTSQSGSSITIGTVTTYTLPAGSDASVDINEREENGIVYTDFVFWIPQGEDGSGESKKQYVKVFTKSDFVQVGNLQKYYLSIPQREHKLVNPYVIKMVANQSDDAEDGAYMTSVVCSERLLPTGTIKVYVTVDLNSYTSFDGKIYLKGE